MVIRFFAHGDNPECKQKSQDRGKVNKPKAKHRPDSLAPDRDQARVTRFKPLGGK